MKKNNEIDRPGLRKKRFGSKAYLRGVQKKAKSRNEILSKNRLK